MDQGTAIGTRRPASWRSMLLAVPVRNAAAEVAQEDRTGLRISVRRERAAWWAAPLSRLLRRSPRRTVILDRLGAEVWELCDGARTVEGVVEEFARRHALSFHESRAAVTTYLKGLIQRGLLAIGIPPLPKVSDLREGMPGVLRPEDLAECPPEGMKPSGGKTPRNTLPKAIRE